MRAHSSGALAEHLLQAAHPDDLHDDASLKAPPQAGERYGLPRSQRDKQGQQPRGWMLLH